MANCVDKNDQTVIAAAALQEAPYVNSRGEYTLQQIDKFAEELANNIQQDSERNPIIIASNQYGTEAFYESYNSLNSFLRNEEDLDLYPDLQKRLNIGDITALEYADFIKEFNLTPNTFNNRRNTNRRSLLFQLNNYYKGSFSNSILGGFCKLMPEIFRAVEQFFTFLGKVQELLDDAARFLDKVRDFRNDPTRLTKRKIVEKLIKEIKEKILEFIDEIFASLTDAIGGFDETEYEDAGERIAARARFLKEEALSFFNEDNKEKIKKKFKGIFEYTIGLFENPSLEEIQFAVARFCAFATGIEALMRDVKSPINNFGSKYTTVFNRLQAISHATSAEAIRNGAIRVSDETKKEAINNIQQNLWIFDPEREAVNVSSDFAGIPPEQPIRKEFSTPTGEPPVNTPPISSSEYGTLPTFDNIRKNRDPRFRFSGNWVTALGEQGWTRLDDRVKIALLRLQKELLADQRNFPGVSVITITSAWRSQSYNKQIGGVANSQHISGLAVDIAIPAGLGTVVGSLRSSISSVRLARFRELAKKCGFKYMYINDRRGFIHLDIVQRAQRRG